MKHEDIHLDKSFIAPQTAPCECYAARVVFCHIYTILFFLELNCCAARGFLTLFASRLELDSGEGMIGQELLYLA